MNLDIITEETGDQTERRVAVFSPDRLYRYTLAIRWEAESDVLVAITLNPSPSENDPVIQQICQRARRLGLGGVMILHLFALREANRLKMLQVDDPVGPLNNSFLEAGLALAELRGTVLVGWGNEGASRGRDKEVAALMREFEVQAYCLKISANGQPVQPQNFDHDEPLVPWPAEDQG